MKDEYAFEAEIYDHVWGRIRNYDADVKFLNELLRRYGCKSVIDVGCGTGNHAIRLSKLGYKVTGVDISPAMLKRARHKDKNRQVEFLQGDMKRLKAIVSGSQNFDAAISLGHVFYHLATNKEVEVFLDGLHRILKKNGLFVFNAKNAKKIGEEYLNKLMLDHVTNEEGIQIAVLAYNRRDPDNPNIIVWMPICLVNMNGKIDFQIREHRLRWFDVSELKRLLAAKSFEMVAVYSGPSKERFKEDVHSDMWFVATAK